MKLNTAQLTIGKLAKQTGHTAVAIRHYEKLGLIKPTRSAAKYRLYPVTEAPKLIFIKNAQAVGFTLKEISALLDLIENKKASSKIIKSQAINKINEIKSKIATLKKIQDILEHWTTACDGKASLEKCPILHGLFKPN